MEQRLPQFRRHIEEASMTELKDFLERIKEFSAKIGHNAIEQVGLRANTTLRFRIKITSVGACSTFHEINHLLC